MRNPDFLFFQGTTPGITLNVPMELDEGAIIYVTFSQKFTRVLEYNDGGTADAAVKASGAIHHDSGSVYIAMTQEDTLRLKVGDAALQIRVLQEDGTASTSFPIYGVICAADKGGVIGD